MITIEFVKDYFPYYDKYFVDANGVYQDTILQKEIDLSGQQILEYVPDLTSTNITEPLKLHLLNIVKKRGFARKHGDSEFEHKPQILKDYEATLVTLEKYRKEYLQGPQTTSDDKIVSITAKTRRFDTWFV